jgi:hypothetical protein
MQLALEPKHMTPSQPAPAGSGTHDGSTGKALSLRLRTLEHAMRTPVGTLAASLELLNAARDPQSVDGAVQTMSRQVRLLTSQLEQLHDIGRDLAAAETGPP